MLFQRSLVFVCACLYLAHVNNVCAPIQRVVGVWMQLGGEEGVFVYVRAVGIFFKHVSVDVCSVFCVCACVWRCVWAWARRCLSDRRRNNTQFQVFKCWKRKA